MLVEEGNKQAIILDKILGNSRKMLSTILIGNNIVNIAASSLTTIFMQSVFNVSWIVSIGVGILTLVIIIFGEIIPKTVASIYADSIALALSLIHIYNSFTLVSSAYMSYSSMDRPEPFTPSTASVKMIVGLLYFSLTRPAIIPAILSWQCSKYITKTESSNCSAFSIASRCV